MHGLRVSTSSAKFIFGRAIPLTTGCPEGIALVLLFRQKAPTESHASW